MIAIADLRNALRVEDDTPAAENDLIRDYERAAVAFVERDTGRYFGPAVERTDYFTAYGQPVLWLENTPAGAVTVTSDGTAVDAADFETRGRRIVREGGWGDYRRPVEIAATYTAGGTVPDPVGAPDVWEAPADIRNAVRMLTGHWYENRIPVATGTVAPEIKLTVDAILGKWRRL